MVGRGAVLGGLVLGLAWGMLGCAGAMQSKAMAPPADSMGGAAANSKGEAADEIESLMRDIERHSGNYREEFGVEANTPANGGGGAPTAEEGPESAARTPDCELVCGATQAICFSSERICSISSRFPADASFAERCTWSSGECMKAKPACESCGD